MKLNTPGSIYIIRAGEFYKLGVALQPRSRLSEMQSGCPFLMELICTERVADSYGLERDLHNLFFDQHVRGEWFRLSPDQVVQAIALIRQNTNNRMPDATSLRWVKMCATRDYKAGQQKRRARERLLGKQKV